MHAVLVSCVSTSEDIPPYLSLPLSLLFFLHTHSIHDHMTNTITQILRYFTLRTLRTATTTTVATTTKTTTLWNLSAPSLFHVPGSMTTCSYYYDGNGTRTTVFDIENRNISYSCCHSLSSTSMKPLMNTRK